MTELLFGKVQLDNAVTVHVLLLGALIGVMAAHLITRGSLEAPEHRLIPVVESRCKQIGYLFAALLVLWAVIFRVTFEICFYLSPWDLSKCFGYAALGRIFITGIVFGVVLWVWKWTASFEGKVEKEVLVVLNITRQSLRSKSFAISATVITLLIVFHLVSLFSAVPQRQVTETPRPEKLSRVYFVKLGKFSSPSPERLVQYYGQKLGLDIRVLPEVPFERMAVNYGRQQLVAEELVELMKRAYQDLANDPQAVLIGITTDDMYIRKSSWRYAFSWRHEWRFAVVSSARMDPVFFREPADDELAHIRLQKMISKNVGIMYYGLPQSKDRRSVLFGPILSRDDLDSIGEDF